MTEVYPSDSELLNEQIDDETGVEFIPTGQSPYYLHFRKMLYRLLLACKRANDLRVFDEGDLDIGVKAGKFWLGTEFVSFAGSTGNSLADNKPNIFIYLNSDGAIVTDEYSAFPEMSTSPHIRLAIVTTSNGDITAIEDCRSGHNFIVPFDSLSKAKIHQHANDANLVAGQSGSIHTNAGASGTITIFLPVQADEGLIYTFCVQAGEELRIDPGAAAIKDTSGQAAGKYKSSSQIGACITVVSDSSGDWIVTSKSGTWNQET